MHGYIHAHIPICLNIAIYIYVYVCVHINISICTYVLTKHKPKEGGLSGGLQGLDPSFPLPRKLQARAAEEVLDAGGHICLGHIGSIRGCSR